MPAPEDDQRESEAKRHPRRRGRARRKTAGEFSLNFAKFRENSPHVPLVEKARQGFFDKLKKSRHPAGFFVVKKQN